MKELVDAAKKNYIVLAENSRLRNEIEKLEGT